MERLRALRPRQHYTPGELQLAASDEPRARYYTVNDILVDNDLVIAAIGRNVQTWRAGTAKGRQSGKETAGARKASAPGRERGPARTLDLRDLHHDAVESHYEIQAENEIERHSVSHEQAHRAALADLGLADGDAALQYALMLSQETGEQSGLGAGAGAAPEHENECTGYEGYEDDSAYNEYPDEMSDAEADAIRAVEAFMRAEQEAQQPAPAPAPEGEDPEDLAEILEMIRLAEERERNS